MKVASAIDTHMAEKLLGRSLCPLCLGFAPATYYAGAVVAIVGFRVVSYRQGYVCSTTHMST
jgi:hypothetical protein